MGSKRVTFIVNPNSGGGSTGKEWPEIKAKAKVRLGDFDSLLTAEPGDAIRLARKAKTSGAGVIVCVGGDGTLNEVVNGLMSAGRSRGSPPLLGLIPRGTGCDFARSLNIPRKLEMALDAIQACKSRAIDLGRFSFRDHEGQTSTRYFHNVLSFGLGGEVDERVNKTTKACGGFISFIWATIIGILCYDKKRIRLRVDDRFDEEVVAWNVAVANGQYHGGGMRVAPGATMEDGLFQVTVVGDLSLVDVFWSLRLLYTGKIYSHQKVMRLEGRRIEAASAQRVLLDMDGEQPGSLPVVIEIIPSALDVLCSP